ncbi:uncharacterized protein OCT59_022533 [Rhizophagus irregularis]|uniref:Uncharacterized protein n=1 Tax=Rhizophagus irregularis (strain DAOM 181602 / DAOM 197198 / MUCL 43194) TaxID=747089 RepID=A0A2P4Q9U1_RHIID|nr:hypothetical protein GLOIN_2v1873675 [Rhizophagus irregularis DAOM 181602=DAOM 197198]POG74410.1 hypothetical protein GLOIN_2v1873675 [Rhizophagus irregularis DAOM 181602=DAOM 197198]UZO29037.1 hypothetical protein OCT59_022533 [Rhizophagus irregularis]GBC50974.2 hypothetical protein GLOIN_2v1873675 [Rhizophagus irregularis DAOM 181602=DAOM 197198]|eukprot:XP_025181276.1 hypothetical protein GLOIN_2v1873675 [Rhizophagus irregularis DAOM 181602=DAOM 197198]
MLTFDVLSIEETITILGPNNNYITFTFPKSEEILNRSYKKNLNAFFLFQNDLKKAIKKSKSSSNQFVEFINNIPIIWDKTPETIKSKYKVLSGELEKLNKPSGLTIVSYDPGQKKKYKRRPKENYIRQRNDKINKEKKNLDKLSVDKNFSLMNPEAKPPPVISSVVPPLELSGVFMLPPDESSVSPPLQLMDLMKNTSLIPDVSYPVIPSNPLPDVIPLPSQFQSTETDFFMENTAIYDQYAEYFRLKNYENTVDYFDYSNYANNFL